jgi:uncharacterized protein (TIGR02452 family)
MANRSELKKIFEDTYSRAQVDYPYQYNCVNYPETQSYNFSREKPSNYDFLVTKGDCIDDCIPELQTNRKVLLINSASMVHVGGGVVNGATAQEEAICRRSNLYLALQKVDQALHYPLFNKTKGIYTPKVTVFKDQQYNLCNPFQIDILSIFSRPYNKIKSQQELELLNKNMFETIFSVCNEQQIDTLVIVPIGCGAFRHDPNFVASAFDWYLKMIPLQTVKKIIVSCYNNDYNYQTFSYYFN